MLFALLYDNQDQIVAAAFACDQMPIGDRYWQECHLAPIEAGQAFQTAYVKVTHPALQRQLLWLGLDETVDAAEVTAALERHVAPAYELGRAA